MEHSYWWCDNCKEEVDPHRVTFAEMHEDCGYPVRSIELGTPPGIMDPHIYRRMLVIQAIKEFKSIANPEGYAINIRWTPQLIAKKCCDIADAIVAEVEEREKKNEHDIRKSSYPGRGDRGPEETGKGPGADSASG